MLFVDYSQLVSFDARIYFDFAQYVSSNVALPSHIYYLHNMGFPLTLAGLFHIILPFHNFDVPQLQNIQKIFTVIISTATIPLIFAFCNKYFDKRYALLGAVFFAFEPHLIQNSTFGITEPLFIFFSLLAWCLFYSKSEKLIFISFVFVGLASITRLEGLMLYPLFLILLHLKRKQLKPKNHLFLLSLIFIIPIIIIILIGNNDGTGGAFTAKITKEMIRSNQMIHDGITINGIHKPIGQMIFNSFVYFGWSATTFLFFIPLGLYALSKHKQLCYELILSLGVVSISGLVAYLHAYDTRYFFPAYPFFILISLFCIKWLDAKVRLRLLS